MLDEAIEMLMASHETTGATLAWAFFLIGEAFARMSSVYALACVAQRWRLEVVADGPPALNAMTGYFFRNGLPVRVVDRRLGRPA